VSALVLRRSVLVVRLQFRLPVNYSARENADIDCRHSGEPLYCEKGQASRSPPRALIATGHPESDGSGDMEFFEYIDCNDLSGWRGERCGGGERDDPGITRPRIPEPSGSRPFSRGPSGTAAKVRVGTPSRLNAPDRVRAVRRTEPGTKRGRKARDARFPGIHAHKREERKRVLHGEAQDNRQAYAGKAATD
jgi:hypothetical protein